MKINLHILKPDLGDIVSGERVGADRLARKLAYPAIWKPGMPVDEGVLHVLAPQTPFPSARSRPASRPASFVLMGDRDDIDTAPLDSCLFVKEDDPERLLSRLLEAFAFYDRWEDSLMEAVLAGWPLAEFGRLSEPVFGKPIILYDRFYQTLFYVHDTFEGNVLPERSINDAIPEREMERVREESTFFDVRTPYSSPTFRRELGFGHLCYNLFRGPKRLGILSVLEGASPIDDRDYALIAYLGDLLGKVIASDPGGSPSVSGRLHAKIKALAAGEAVSRNELEAALSDVGWMAAGRFACVSLVDTTKVRSTKQLAQVADRVCGASEGIVDIVRDHAVTFVCNLERLRLSPLEAARMIAGHAHVARDHDRIGASGVFRSFDQLGAYRLLSLSAVELGMRAGGDATVFCFEDHLISYVAQACSEKGDVRALIPHELILLAEHDETHGTDLLSFTRAYLENERSIVGTARAMFIHRNTVLARVEKVREITGVDFDDPAVRRKLIVALALMDS